MSLFSLPVAIRRRICVHLLVDHEPISFQPEFLDEWTAQVWPEETEAELCLAILFVNKQIHKEAIEVLYGDNRFQFAELDATSTRCRTPLAVFVQQLGPANAQRLRHISIDFPTAPLASRSDVSISSNMCLENMGLLQKSCPRLATLEMSLPPERTDFVLGNTVRFTEFLGVLQAGLKGFASLQEVKVNVALLGWDMNENVDSDGDRWKSHRKSLRELQGHGWKADISKIPIQTNQIFW